MSVTCGTRTYRIGTACIFHVVAGNRSCVTRHSIRYAATYDLRRTAPSEHEQTFGREDRVLSANAAFFGTLARGEDGVREGPVPEPLTVIAKFLGSPPHERVSFSWTYSDPTMAGAGGVG